MLGCAPTQIPWMSFIPTTTINGVDVAGLTVREAQEKLEAGDAGTGDPHLRRRQPVTETEPRTPIATVTLAELGFSPEAVEASVRSPLTSGRRRMETQARAFLQAAGIIFAALLARGSRRLRWDRAETVHLWSRRWTPRRRSCLWRPWTAPMSWEDTLSPSPRPGTAGRWTGRPAPGVGACGRQSAAVAEAWCSTAELPSPRQDPHRPGDLRRVLRHGEERLLRRGDGVHRPGAGRGGLRRGRGPGPAGRGGARRDRHRPRPGGAARRHGGGAGAGAVPGRAGGGPDPRGRHLRPAVQREALRRRHQRLRDEHRRRVLLQRRGGPADRRQRLSGRPRLCPGGDGGRDRRRHLPDLLHAVPGLPAVQPGHHGAVRPPVRPRLHHRGHGRHGVLGRAGLQVHQRHPVPHQDRHHLREQLPDGPDAGHQCGRHQREDDQRVALHHPL